MAELSGKSAKIRYTSILGTSSTDNAATISTGGGTGVSSVQINATGRRHWDRSATAVPDLYLNSTLVPSTAIEKINPVQGIFNLNESRTSTGTYTIDCHFLTSTHLTGGKSWSADVDVEMLDTTTFSTSTSDVTWRTFIPGLSEADVSIDRLHSTGDTGPVFYDRLNLENDVLIELITNNANRFEGFAYVETDGWENDIEDLVAESVDLKVTGELYFSTT
jgi:hypothetical protein